MPGSNRTVYEHSDSFVRALDEGGMIWEKEHSMDVINRAVAVIKPRQPYLDWAKSIPGPGMT